MIIKFFNFQKSENISLSQPADSFKDNMCNVQYTPIRKIAFYSRGKNGGL